MRNLKHMSELESCSQTLVPFQQVNRGKMQQDYQSSNVAVAAPKL